MKRIGITGGIGSGKSTVVKLFHEMGIPYIDADTVARDLRQPGMAAHSAILKRFGTDDRLELRKILSTDPAAKKDLEAILHPLIKTESDARLQKIEATSTAPFVLYEAALLIEAARAKEFDALIVVTASEKAKIDRIVSRDQITPEAAHAMISAQMSDSDRSKFATHTIENSGTLEDLRDQVTRLYSLLAKKQ